MELIPQRPQPSATYFVPVLIAAAASLAGCSDEKQAAFSKCLTHQVPAGTVVYDDSLAPATMPKAASGTYEERTEPWRRRVLVDSAWLAYSGNAEGVVFLGKQTDAKTGQVRLVCVEAYVPELGAHNERVVRLHAWVLPCNADAGHKGRQTSNAMAIFPPSGKPVTIYAAAHDPKDLAGFTFNVRIDGGPDLPIAAVLRDGEVRFTPKTGKTVDPTEHERYWYP